MLQVHRVYFLPQIQSQALLQALCFRLVRSYGFSVVMTERRRTDDFKLWCWRRFLRVPWTARRSNQLILKEINPEYSLEDWCWGWSSNTLTTWWEKLTRWKRRWCWERLKAGERATEDKMAGWHHRLNGHEFEQTLGDSEGQRRLACCSPWDHKELDTA